MSKHILTSPVFDDQASTGKEQDVVQAHSPDEYEIPEPTILGQLKDRFKENVRDLFRKYDQEYLETLFKRQQWQIIAKQLRKFAKEGVQLSGLRALKIIEEGYSTAVLEHFSMIPYIDRNMVIAALLKHSLDAEKVLAKVSGSLNFEVADALLAQHNYQLLAHSLHRFGNYSLGKEIQEILRRKGYEYQVERYFYVFKDQQ